MSSEWPEGTVAVATVRGHKGVRVLRTRSGIWLHPPINSYEEGALQSATADYRVADVRPLVVIDPEDLVQVKRLSDLCQRERSRNSTNAASMLVALHKFASPTPAIEEPTGLGAVVDDAEGRRWVRVNEKWWNHWESADPTAYLSRQYADLNVVRVLSHGYAAEEES